jgi:hypothetical protein
VQSTFWRFINALHLNVARQLLAITRTMRERVWAAANVSVAPSEGAIMAAPWGPGRHRWMAAKAPATFDGHAGILTALAQAREKEARAAGGWSAINF